MPVYRSPKRPTSELTPHAVYRAVPPVSGGRGLRSFVAVVSAGKRKPLRSQQFPAPTRSMKSRHRARMSRPTISTNLDFDKADPAAVFRRLQATTVDNQGGRHGGQARDSDIEQLMKEFPDRRAETTACDASLRDGRWLSLGTDFRLSPVDKATRNTSRFAEGRSPGNETAEKRLPVLAMALCGRASP